MAFDKIAVQLYPSAATDTVIYTCPGVTQSDVISIFIANQSATSDRFTINHVIGGGASTTASVLYPSIYISGYNTALITTPIFMVAGDVLRVTSLNGTCSFNLEITEKT